jgi:hypothetical protein
MTDKPLRPSECEAELSHPSTPRPFGIRTVSTHFSNIWGEKALNGGSKDLKEGIEA